MADTLPAAKKQRGCRLLLIDDNPHGLAARKGILDERGYEVATAHNGGEGLRCFEAALAGEPFDLVVTDYRMPDVSGVDVVRRMKSAAPHLPVVMLSGYAERLALTPESTGADAVLAKGPREHRDLVRAVESLLPANRLPRSKEPASERESATGAASRRPRRNRSA